MSKASRFVREWWDYLITRQWMRFSAKADPEVQIQQALQESARQLQLLAGTATDVGATQIVATGDLDKAMKELGRLNRNFDIAVQKAAEAEANGDAEKAAQFNAAAITLANSLESQEQRVEEAKKFVLGATDATEKAKKAYHKAVEAHQKRLDKQKLLLGQLAQTRMQQQLNATLDKLGEQVGSAAPSLESVERKIQLSYAKATARGELEEGTVDDVMAQIEEAANNTSAHARVLAAQQRLGLPVGNKS